MPLSKLPLEHQVALLMRGAEFGDPHTHEIMRQELAQRLAESMRTNIPLRVYLGVDPTSSDLHLGHTVPLRKLRQFQELGHQVIFLVGSFTALIGDPSDKDKGRPRQTPEQVRARVRRTLDGCCEGGGYCLGSGNSATNHIPVANYFATVDAGNRYTRSGWGKSKVEPGWGLRRMGRRAARAASSGA